MIGSIFNCCKYHSFRKYFIYFENIIPLLMMYLESHWQERRKIRNTAPAPIPESVNPLHLIPSLKVFQLYHITGLSGVVLLVFTNNLILSLYSEFTIGYDRGYKQRISFTNVHLEKIVCIYILKTFLL